jgi:hypothetical protein
MIRSKVKEPEGKLYKFGIGFKVGIGFILPAHGNYRITPVTILLFKNFLNTCFNNNSGNMPAVLTAVCWSIWCLFIPYFRHYTSTG